MFKFNSVLLLSCLLLMSPWGLEAQTISPARPTGLPPAGKLTKTENATLDNPSTKSPLPYTIPRPGTGSKDSITLSGSRSSPTTSSSPFTQTPRTQKLYPKNTTGRSDRSSYRFANSTTGLMGKNRLVRPSGAKSVTGTPVPSTTAKLDTDSSPLMPVPDPFSKFREKAASQFSYPLTFLDGYGYYLRRLKDMDVKLCNA